MNRHKMMCYPSLVRNHTKVLMLVDVIAFKHKINVCKHVCNPSYYVLFIKIHTRDLFGRENVLAILAPTNRGQTVHNCQVQYWWS